MMIHHYKKNYLNKINLKKTFSCHTWQSGDKWLNMKYIFSFFVKGLIRFIPYNSVRKISRYKDILFTHWVKQDFLHFGENSYLERGLRLWNPKYISIGKDVVIRRLSNLSAWDSYFEKTHNPIVKIDDGCSIGEFFNISCINKITIGKNALIGRWVTVIDHSHGHLIERELLVPPVERELVSKGEIFIGNNVWIGDKVTICPDVHIYEGAIIGANSVVTKDVQANTIVAGVPARVIKYLQD